MAYKGFTTFQENGQTFRLYSTGTIALFNNQESKFKDYPTTACIYLVTDKTTNRQYIGSTVNMRKRMRGYYNKDLNKQVFSGLAFNDLEITIIEDCKGIELKDMYLKEYNYVRQYNTVYPAGNNIQCPVSKIRFDLLDLNIYDPLTYKHIKAVCKYNKDRYQLNKEHISNRRKARYKLLKAS